MKNSIIPMPPAQYRGGLFALAAVLIWAGIVFFAFFAHVDGTFRYWGLLFSPTIPSSDPTQWLSIELESLKALLVSALILGVTLSVGKRARSFLGLRFSNAWLTWSFEFVLGVLVLDLFWIGTGFCGLWYAPVWGVVAGGLVLLLLTDLIHGSPESFKRFSWPAWGWAYGFAAVVGLGYVVLSLFADLTPECFYDSMVYHLAVPQYWLTRHGMADLSTNFFANYPYGAELYFLNGFVLQGAEAAKMLHLGAWVFAALLAGGWANEISDGKAGPFAFGLTLTFPLVTMAVWATQVEGLLSLVVVLACYSLVRWAKKPEARWAWVTGLLAGSALGIKYNGIVLLACAFIAAGFYATDLYRKSRWKHWVLFLAGAVLAAGPWLLKNGVYTGNPFFPYLNGLFHGRHLSQAGYDQLLSEQQGRLTSAWWEWFLLPWKIVMSNPATYSFTGPVVLMLTPFLFLFRFKSAVLRFFVWTVGLAFIVSFAVTHIMRFMDPNFLLLFVLLSVVLAGGDRPFWGKAAAWMVGLCGLLCAGYAADIIHYHYDFADVLWGRQSRSQYLASDRRMNSYEDMANWIAASVPAHKRLLIVGDARGLYYSQTALNNTVFDEQLLAQIARECPDAVSIGERLREMGVDALVVNGWEGVRVSAEYHHYDLTTDQWKRLDEFIQRGTQLVYSKNFQAVYGILPQLSPQPKEEMADLILFFSPPGSQFFKSARAQDWNQAKTSLDEAVRLYAFSPYWKGQEVDLEQAMSSQRTHE